MATLGAAQRRLARAVQARSGNAALLVRFGKVTTVTPGASTDGQAAVTVTLRSTTTPAPYLDSYGSPTVGDFVAVLLVDGSPLILGRVRGLPSF